MIIGLIIISSKEAISLAYITNFNEKMGIANKTFHIMEESYESVIKIPLVVVTENIIRNSITPPSIAGAISSLYDLIQALVENIINGGINLFLTVYVFKFDTQDLKKDKS